jgi:hypothetical protein
MATKLTVKYIEDHMGFSDKSALDLGKKIGDLMLKEAKERIIKNGEAENIKFDGTFELKSFNGVCVDVQVCFPFVGCFTTHVGV